MNSYGPQIVTSGLKVYLDANNITSYSNGDTWYNLIGDTYNGKLSGSTYLSGGALRFTKANSTDFIDFGDIILTKNMSISFWIYPTSTTSGQAFFAKNTASGGNYLLIGYWSSSGTKFHINLNDNYVYALSAITNEWINYTTTFEYISSNLTRCNSYKNGVIFDSTLLSTEVSTNVGTFILGMEYDSTSKSDFFDGSISSFLLYDKVLNSSEIKRNFNAIKGRFNL